MPRKDKTGCFFGCFLLFGGVVFLPGLLIEYFFLQKVEEIEKNGHPKKAKLFVVVTCIAVVVVLALLVQHFQRGA
jgi:hypothetical protein